MLHAWEVFGLVRQHVADRIRDIVLAPTIPLPVASARYNLEYIFAERANCLMASHIR